MKWGKRVIVVLLVVGIVALVSQFGFEKRITGTYSFADDLVIHIFPDHTYQTECPLAGVTNHDRWHIESPFWHPKIVLEGLELVPVGTQLEKREGDRKFSVDIFHATLANAHYTLQESPRVSTNPLIELPQIEKSMLGNWLTEGDDLYFLSNHHFSDHNLGSAGTWSVHGERLELVWNEMSATGPRTTSLEIDSKNRSLHFGPTVYRWRRDRTKYVPTL